MSAYIKGEHPLTNWFNRNIVQQFPSLDLEELPIDYEEAVSECCGEEITDNGFCVNCGEHAI